MERKGKLWHTQESQGTILIKGMKLKYRWRRNSGKKHLPLKTTERKQSYGTLSFQTIKSAAAQIAVRGQDMSSEGKHGKCIVMLPSDESHKCASEILLMWSSARVWKGGRVAFPIPWQYALRKSNRWSLQHHQPFQAALLTLPACFVLAAVGKGLMMRFLASICSLNSKWCWSTSNNFPSILKVCPSTASPNTA